ncbi:MAG: cytochrome o ubiquinol oxidase subunit IV [Pseudomonadota bacterium]
MSGSAKTAHENQEQGRQEDLHQQGGHGSFRSYMIGFVLSVILTIIPFSIVMGGLVDSKVLAIGIVFTLGAAQMLVHIYYFLHVNARAEEGWLAMSLTFTVLLVVIVLAGSIWVMFHLEENMMPAHEQIERIKSLP